ncbi:MAG: porin [Pseudomonadota bacterium]|nr:porin [Pseudomonadota bacterium]
MKKTLIALSVLAASGAAMAQSSVTLYGAADVWFGSFKAPGAVRQTAIGSGGIDDSFFGFKGSEDLGGGLRANFVLEQGFTIDNGAGFRTTDNLGAPVNATFGRQAYVGFSSGYGEVRVGKTFTPFDDISGATTPAFDSALAPTSNVWASTGYNANPNNTVYYASPSLSGFSVAGSFSLGENKSPAIKAGKLASAHIKYANGPVYVGLAYQAERLLPTDRRVNFTRLNGSYDLGVVKLLAGYGRVENQGNSNAETDEWQIGADFPVSSALTLSGGYARSKDNAATVATPNAKRTGVGLAANYSLSKRTAVYGGVQASKQKQANVPELKGSLYAVGVRHTF